MKSTHPSTLNTLFWVILFSIAMAFLESAVVIYLRQLYYPQGFDFPLTLIDGVVARTEFLRELATLVMLLGVGWLAGKNRVQRFAYFLLTFAIWDIFYYVFLYLILGWPEYLNTWDVLFLVPVMWVGPAWEPMFIACLMIVLTGILLRLDYLGKRAWPNTLEWTLLIGGSLVVILSWVWEYSGFLLELYPEKGWGVFMCADCQLEASSHFVPFKVYREIFTPGVLLILAGQIHLWIFGLRTKV